MVYYIMLHLLHRFHPLPENPCQKGKAGESVLEIPMFAELHRLHPASANRVD